MRTNISKFALVAALMLAITFTLSCSSGDDGGGNNGDTTSLNGTWNASGGRSIIFAGNTFEYKINNVTAYYGTFYVSGSSFVYTANTGETASIDFQLSGETLVLSNSTGSDKSANGTYIKAGGSNNGSGGGDFVNANNEAWVLCLYDDECYGNIFKQNGDGIKIKYNGNYWCIERTYTYSISGNQVNFCNSKGCQSMPYSISGNTATIVEDGKSKTVTRTSGVYVSGNCPDDDF